MKGKYLCFVVFLMLAIACKEEEKSEIVVDKNELNGVVGSVKSVLYSSDDDHYDIYICMDEVTDITSLFNSSAEPKKFLLVSVDKQLVGHSIDLTKETKHFQISDYAFLWVGPNLQPGQTDIITAGTLEIKSVSEERIALDLALSVKSGDGINLSYEGVTKRCTHSWDSALAPYEFSYNGKVYAVSTVLYDAAVYGENVYRFYERQNATAGDTPFLTLRVPESNNTDGSSLPITAERVVSLTLSDGTRLDGNAEGTFSILRSADDIRIQINGKTEGAQSFNLRYNGEYSMWYPEERTLNNEFSFSGQNPSKICKVFAAPGGKSNGISLYFCRRILGSILGAKGFEAVEVRVPNTIWDGESKNLSDIGQWYIRYGDAGDPQRGYLFVSESSGESVVGTVTLKRNGGNIQLSLDAEMVDREEKYNPNIAHPRMKIEYNGPVEGDTYGLTNQLAINEEIYSIGTTLMDKSDETLYQIYLCEETGVKHFSKLGEGDNYMKFVLPISKLGEGREQVTLEASDCTEISSGGKSITGASGSIKILPEQSGKIGFVADITSEGTRYQAAYTGEYTAPGSSITRQLSPGYVYYINSNGQTTFMASKDASTYEELQEYPYLVLKMDNELMENPQLSGGEGMDFKDISNYFCIEYYEQGEKMISVSSEDLDGVSGSMQFYKDMTLNVALEDAIGNVLQCWYFGWDDWTDVSGK